MARTRCLTVVVEHGINPHGHNDHRNYRYEGLRLELLAVRVCISEDEHNFKECHIEVWPAKLVSLPDETEGKSVGLSSLE